MRRIRCFVDCAADRKSTRLNSSHTEIYTLSLHDALPIWWAKEIDSLLVKGDDLALLVTNHDVNHIFADYLREGEIPNTKSVRISADENIVNAIVECEEFVALWIARQIGRAHV